MMKFNADEVFEMGEEIERNGSRFYRLAAENEENPELKGILNRLAEMEEDHEKLFHNMRVEMQQEGLPQVDYDPDAEAPLYLQAMVDTTIFKLTEDASQELTGSESAAEILHRAIEAEKESVLFYVAIKDRVPEELGKEKIEWLIKEEMEHIGTLSQQLRCVEK